MSKDYALSTNEVFRIINKPVGFCLFSDMWKTSLDDLLATGGCLINYLSSSNMGHWVGCNRVGNRIIYFNPSGSFIDDTIEYIPKEWASESNQDYPHLLKKLVGSNYDVEWMNYPLQKPNTNVCGRWTALFLRYPHIPVDDFINIFKSMSMNTLIDVTDVMMNRKDINNYIKKCGDKKSGVVMNCAKILELIEELNRCEVECSESSEEVCRDVEVPDSVEALEIEGGKAQKRNKDGSLRKKYTRKKELVPVEKPIKMTTKGVPRKPYTRKNSSKPTPPDSSNFREFVRAVNGIPLMVHFVGTGKKRVQSMLYKMRKAMTDEEFIEYLRLINAAFAESDKTEDTVSWFIAYNSE